MKIKSLSKDEFILLSQLFSEKIDFLVKAISDIEEDISEITEPDEFLAELQQDRLKHMLKDYYAYKEIYDQLMTYKFK